MDISKLRMDSMGLYFGTLAKGGLRLSIDGSQLIGPLAKKNVLEVDKKEMRCWLKGNELEKQVEMEGYIIMKCEKDYLGCGFPKNGRIMTFVPKSRRILAAD